MEVLSLNEVRQTYLATLEDYLLELRITLFNLLKPGVLKKSGLERTLGVQQRRPQLKRGAEGIRV